MRPRIGVTTSRRGGRFMWQANRLALLRAGAAAVRLRPGGPLPVEELHGLVIGGGDDITATLYGGAVDPAIRIDRARDRLELDLLGEAARRFWPVLGICRGAQMLNVFLGGSLHGDIHAAYAGAPRLRTVLPRKMVHVEPDSLLASILGCCDCRVNALHHQSIDRLGQGLRVVARDGHGIIQAVERDGPPFTLGVQWHPEFLPADRGQQRLFRALAAAARDGAAARAAADQSFAR